MLPINSCDSCRRDRVSPPQLKEGHPMNQHNLKQSDDQFLAISEAMDLAANAMEQHGTDALLVINVSENGSSAILGGAINEATIEKLDGLLAELKANRGADLAGVLHVWPAE
ncbi:MAG: hypothetical protein K2Y25_09240 [Pseudomonadaceae bacterium]|nr:hypothetical protein [Pseudomonadaceae bacterium]